MTAATAFLIAAAFVTSTLTATLGLGGGVLLIALMPGLVPAAAIVPIHGAVQLASNASRVMLGAGRIDWRVVGPFTVGATAGAVAGAGVVARVNVDHLPLYLGTFVLLVTWIPMPARVVRFPGQFVILGAVQTAVSLLVGATGPLTSPFLLRRGLPKDRLVVTLGALMTTIHVFKLAVFVSAGFAYGPHLPLIAGMVLAVVLGSGAGTMLRAYVPDAALRRTLKWLITVLACRMILGTVF